MPTPHKLTVFVLCYGPHTELAKRCLESLYDPSANYQVRVFLNACCQETVDYIFDLRDETPDFLQVVYQSDTNVCKYPAMRKMFHDKDYPITTPYVAWFDDDSYLRVPAHQWEASLSAVLQPNTMRGDIWFHRLAGQQADWIRDQPWYARKPITADQRVRFITGGHWVIDTDVIHRFDWPSPDIKHRGGDVMLGELCRQQGIALVKECGDVAVNADAQGNSSKSPRRGFDERPVGYSYHRRIASQVPLNLSAVRTYSAEPRRKATQPVKQSPPKPYGLDL